MVGDATPHTSPLAVIKGIVEIRGVLAHAHGWDAQTRAILVETGVLCEVTNSGMRHRGEKGHKTVYITMS